MPGSGTGEAVTPQFAAIITASRSFTAPSPLKSPWCFRAQLYTLFKIDKSRASKVLVEVLGKEFNGVLGCDYFGAYRKYMREFGVLVQFCMAHLIRDVKFLITLADKKQKAYGCRVRKALKELFGVIHRRDEMTAKAFQKSLEAATRVLPKTRFGQGAGVAGDY